MKIQMFKLDLEKAEEPEIKLQTFTAAAAAKSLQSCPTLCDPMDCSPPGSSVHRILEARILEWVAISFSKAVTRFEMAWLRLCGCLLKSPLNLSICGTDQSGILQVFEKSV